jgi:hypothetical protein
VSPRSVDVLSRRRRAVSSALQAYVRWRKECAEVRAAYRRWASADRHSAASEYAAYTAALEREEGAAARYARLAKRAELGPGPGVAHQVGRPRRTCRAW